MARQISPAIIIILYPSLFIFIFFVLIEVVCFWVQSSVLYNATGLQCCTAIIANRLHREVRNFAAVK